MPMFGHFEFGKDKPSQTYEGDSPGAREGLCQGFKRWPKPNRFGN
jgi:hypothetical protein